MFILHDSYKLDETNWQHQNSNTYQEHHKLVPCCCWLRSKWIHSLSEFCSSWYRPGLACPSMFSAVRQTCGSFGFINGSECKRQNRVGPEEWPQARMGIYLGPYHHSTVSACLVSRKLGSEGSVGFNNLWLTPTFLQRLESRHQAHRHKAKGKPGRFHKDRLSHGYKKTEGAVPNSLQTTEELGTTKADWG